MLKSDDVVLEQERVILIQSVELLVDSCKLFPKLPDDDLHIIQPVVVPVQFRVNVVLRFFYALDDLDQPAGSNTHGCETRAPSNDPLQDLDRQ